MNHRLHPLPQEPADIAASRADAGIGAPPIKRESPGVRRWESVFVLVMFAFIAFAFQGTRGLWDPDEGRYTAVALQMLDSGDWWLPRLNPYREHLTKPPVTYWALAASFGSLGRTELAARLPNAVAFVLTGWLVLLLARRLGLRRPWLAAFVWGTSLVPVLGANVVTTDTLLACLQTLAVWLWWRLQQSEPPQQRRWRWGMWLAFAVAFMVKGPPALLPLIPILVFRRWQRSVTRQPSLVDPASATMFLFVGLGWYAWLVASKPELLHYFLGNEFIGRIFSDTHGRNGQWYGAIKVYVPMALLALMPWGYYAIKIRDQSRPLPWQGAFWRGHSDPTTVLLWLWIALPLCVFVIAQSRLMLYVLPLAVPLSLLAGRAIDRHWLGALTLRRRVALFGWLLIVLLIKGVTTRLDSTQDTRALASKINAITTINAQALLFLDIPGRYALRFYLDRPVEEVTANPSGSFNAQGLRERSLCEALATTPHALVVTDGRLLKADAPTAPMPRCPGWTFTTPIAHSGLWVPARTGQADFGAIATKAVRAVEPTQLSSSINHPVRQSGHSFWRPLSVAASSTAPLPEGLTTRMRF